MKTSTKRATLAIALMAATSFISPAMVAAKTLHISSAGDAGTTDPQAQAVSNTDQLLRQIYEGLLGRDKDLKLIPALATSWEAVEPDRWRFYLREGVTFHEGQPFTAEDVAFSLNRAAGPNSNFKNYTDTLKEVVVVDPLTVDVVTTGPDPILPTKLYRIAMMSKPWAEEHGALEVTAQGTDGYAALNTNGTGPFVMVDRRPNVRTELTLNPDWWGEMDGNVTQYVSTPISSPATRIAALLSGEVDMVMDPPLQDIPRIESNPAVTVATGPENRTILLELDSGRDELLYSDVKGENPMAKVEVRKALYQAIDVDAIVSRIQRGYAVPAGLQIPPMVTGYSEEMDKRLPYDPEAAKALLAEAGYPDGFTLTLDCSNNRYPNDEAVCQAISAMWTQIGVRTTLNAIPLQTFFPKVSAKDSSVFMLGIGSPTLDAYYSVQANLMTGTGDSADGLWSMAESIPEIIDLAIQARTEMDAEKRMDMLVEAMKIAQDEVLYIPLYYPTGVWAMSAKVDATFRADTVIEARYVTIAD